MDFVPSGFLSRMLIRVAQLTRINSYWRYGELTTNTHTHNIHTHIHGIEPLHWSLIAGRRLRAAGDGGGGSGRACTRDEDREYTGAQSEGAARSVGLAAHRLRAHRRPAHKVRCRRLRATAPCTAYTLHPPHQSHIELMHIILLPYMMDCISYAAISDNASHTRLGGTP